MLSAVGASPKTPLAEKEPIIDLAARNLKSFKQKVLSLRQTESDTSIPENEKLPKSTFVSLSDVFADVDLVTS